MGYSSKAPGSNIRLEESRVERIFFWGNYSPTAAGSEFNVDIILFEDYDSLDLYDPLEEGHVYYWRDALVPRGGRAYVANITRDRRTDYQFGQIVVNYITIRYTLVHFDDEQASVRVDLV
jgi:hypothetical protein